MQTTIVNLPRPVAQIHGLAHIVVTRVSAAPTWPQVFSLSVSAAPSSFLTYSHCCIEIQTMDDWNHSLLASIGVFDEHADYYLDSEIPEDERVLYILMFFLSSDLSLPLAENELGK